MKLLLSGVSLSYYTSRVDRIDLDRGSTGWSTYAEVLTRVGLDSFLVNQLVFLTLFIATLTEFGDTKLCQTMCH